MAKMLLFLIVHLLFSIEHFECNESSNDHNLDRSRFQTTTNENKTTTFFEIDDDFFDRRKRHAPTIGGFNLNVPNSKNIRYQANQPFRKLTHNKAIQMSRHPLLRRRFHHHHHRRPHPIVRMHRQRPQPHTIF